TQPERAFRKRPRVVRLGRHRLFAARQHHHQHQPAHPDQPRRHTRSLPIRPVPSILPPSRRDRRIQHRVLSTANVGVEFSTARNARTGFCHPAAMPDWLWWQWLYVALAVILIGISKAGFGGGVGIVAVPLMVLALPAERALGVMLPVLIFGDIMSLLHHHRGA